MRGSSTAACFDCTSGNHKTALHTDDRSIHPHGTGPSARTLSNAIKDQYRIEGGAYFGPAVNRTLMAWWDKFDRA